VPIPKAEKALNALFEKLGATDAAQLARSEVSEGIPQLLRFLFLLEAWLRVQDEADHTWIAREIESAQQHSDRPYSQLGRILERCRARGVSDEDLTDMARCHQAAMMFRLCYLMDSGPEHAPEALEDVSWGLFRVNDNDRPVGPAIDALHESVLAMDPTGREMRPR
jgi:hypothetical protein